MEKGGLVQNAWFVNKKSVEEASARSRWYLGSELHQDPKFLLHRPRHFLFVHAVTHNSLAQKGPVLGV